MSQHSSAGRGREKIQQEYIPDSIGRGKSQRFIKSNRYFTICVYALVMVTISAVIIKCIIDFEQTKAWIGHLLAMLGPFIFGALLAYVLNPMVHVFYKGIERLSTRTGLRIGHTLRRSPSPSPM